MLAKRNKCSELADGMAVALVSGKFALLEDKK